MANVQTPEGKGVKAPVKNNKNDSIFPQKVKNIYCILCRSSYMKNEAHVHMHGMLHHRELDLVLGKNSLLHDCQACKASSMSLNEYAQHISTAQHIAKLKSLISKNVKPKPFPLTKYLGADVIAGILKRNKTLKCKEKKAIKKKKKKQKQLAGPKGTKMPQEAANKNVVKSKVIKLEQNKKVKSHSVVVQNKENKVCSLQRHPHYRESTLQNQSGKSAHFSGEPAGRTWHHTSVHAQFVQPAHQLRYENNSAVNNQCHTTKAVCYQTDTLVQRPHSTQREATDMPVHIRWPAVNQYDHYNKQCDGAADFTSDHLPQSGAIIFGHNESAEQEGSHCSAQPVSAGSPAKAAPIRDIDISTMLRQIRRALGVREPCRADREARRQISEAVGPDGGQPACSSFRNEAKEAAPRSGVCPASITQTEPKQIVNVTQATAQHCEKSLVVSSESTGPSHIRVRESQGAFDNQTSLSRFSGRSSSSEQNPDVAHKSQTAHQPSKVQGEKVSPTLNLSGAKSKLNWREEGRRKKQESEKGTPRFGIEFGNQQSDQNSSTQAEDLPLSEGFHWESIPDCPSGSHRTKLPPAPQNTADDDSHAETQTDNQKQQQQPSEPRDAAQEGCSKTVSVKLERNNENENGDSRDRNSDRKRKHKEAMHEDISEKEPQGKKRKAKSKKDQNQMDQLLAVSLREEELSQSLQDLDKSLVQARNALQAAYAEVQRLLLLRQQFTAEVNSLRAKRIEILQGMQGGYLGVNNAEKAPTSSAGAAAAAVQPRLSPLPSSSAFPTSAGQLPPPTLPAPPVSQPHPAPSALPTMSVKQEMHQPPAVSCNPDAPQVPVNQPVPLFPSLLHASPRLAAPTTIVTSLKQLRTEEPTSASSSSASSPRQQVQVTQAGLKETERSEKADSRSEKEITGGGNLREAPEKPVSTSEPEGEQNAAAAPQRDDGGNESDASVEMMEPSNQVVIDVDESDTEETVSNAPVHQEPPQKSVSVEFSSASTQTFQLVEDEKKAQPTLAPVKDVSAPSECVKGVEDEEPSIGVFKNHTGPVHGLQIYEGLLFTCSGDNTARAYSLKTRECQAVFKGHTNKINCLLVSSLPNLPTRLFTGSSDQTICCYSLKSGKCLQQLSLPDRVLCLHIAWNILFAGLASGSVASYDIKTLKQLDMFECHSPRGVSCLGTAQEGARRVLLVGSYDSTISVRDAKSGLLLRSLEGHTKTVLCMKVVNDLVFSGSSDTSVHAHNIHTGELVRIYKGHGHSVTSIVILGKVMVTACLDKLVRVYELQSHDRLQVYGGHSDMVMCMAVHKSVIYTGCYDGSVQAVKLNLMKNYRCWWQNCSLIFGVAEHLVQHLVGDHSNPKLQTVKCRWRGCSSFFSTQQSVRQELPEHMKIHVKNDSKVQL